VQDLKINAKMKNLKNQNAQGNVNSIVKKIITDDIIDS